MLISDKIHVDSLERINIQVHNNINLILIFFFFVFRPKKSFNKLLQVQQTSQASRRKLHIEHLREQEREQNAGRRRKKLRLLHQLNRVLFVELARVRVQLKHGFEYLSNL